MNYHNPLLALTLILAATASSGSQTLGFTFEPLQCTSHTGVPPTYEDCGFVSLSGAFTFDDIDGDGNIVLAELLNLSMPNISAPGPPGAPGYPSVVTAFDYSAATGLSFSAYVYRFSVVTGVAYSFGAPYGGYRWAWMPNTTLSVYQIPPTIPEPGTSWLLLVGISVVVWRQLWPTRCMRGGRR